MAPRSFCIALVLLMTALSQLTAPARAQDDPLAGQRLYADVERYASFGIHRYGTDGDKLTTDWIADEMRKAGLAVEFQNFSLGKQYFVDRADVTIGAEKIDALPFWWIPEDKPSFTLTAPLAPDDGDASGKIVALHLPYDRTAYLADTHKQAIASAAKRNPAAIVLTIDNPGEDIFVYNVAQDDPPWPMPVVVVAANRRALLAQAQADGKPLTISVAGKYGKDVAGRNVVGKLDRGAQETIVVSTPMTGWFTCACERGSGIAAFLALARTVGATQPNVNVVFVATAGHEVGHGGMEIFLHADPPPPEHTLAWIHIGASVACYEFAKNADGKWATEKKLELRRLLTSSASTAALTDAAFKGQPFNRMVTSDKAPPGELREVWGAKYPNFLGIAAGHRFFHNPTDSVAVTGPEILEPVARALAAAVATLAAKQRDALGGAKKKM
jgi:hypothetical protein